ncbi:hypothetical protein CEXT_61271, partial [Caerostris extrusa]
RVTKKSQSITNFQFRLYSIVVFEQFDWISNLLC